MTHIKSSGKTSTLTSSVDVLLRSYHSPDVFSHSRFLSSSLYGRDDDDHDRDDQPLYLDPSLTTARLPVTRYREKTLVALESPLDMTSFLNCVVSIPTATPYGPGEAIPITINQRPSPLNKQEFALKSVKVFLRRTLDFTVPSPSAGSVSSSRPTRTGSLSPPSPSSSPPPQTYTSSHHPISVPSPNPLDQNSPRKSSVSPSLSWSLVTSSSKGAETPSETDGDDETNELDSQIGDDDDDDYDYVRVVPSPYNRDLEVDLSSPSASRYTLPLDAPYPPNFLLTPPPPPPTIPSLAPPLPPTRTLPKRPSSLSRLKSQFFSSSSTSSSSSSASSSSQAPRANRRDASRTHSSDSLIPLLSLRARTPTAPVSSSSPLPPSSAQVSPSSTPVQSTRSSASSGPLLSSPDIYTTTVSSIAVQPVSGLHEHLHQSRGRSNPDERPSDFSLTFTVPKPTDSTSSSSASRGDYRQLPSAPPLSSSSAPSQYLWGLGETSESSLVRIGFELALEMEFIAIPTSASPSSRSSPSPHRSDVPSDERRNTRGGDSAKRSRNVINGGGGGSFLTSLGLLGSSSAASTSSTFVFKTSPGDFPVCIVGTTARERTKATPRLAPHASSTVKSALASSSSSGSPSSGGGGRSRTRDLLASSLSNPSPSPMTSSDAPSSRDPYRGGYTDHRRRARSSADPSRTTTTTTTSPTERNLLHPRPLASSLSTLTKSLRHESEGTKGDRPSLVSTLEGSDTSAQDRFKSINFSSTSTTSSSVSSSSSSSTVTLLASPSSLSLLSHHHHPHRQSNHHLHHRSTRPSTLTTTTTSTTTITMTPSPPLSPSYSLSTNTNLSSPLPPPPSPPPPILSSPSFPAHFGFPPAPPLTSNGLPPSNNPNRKRRPTTAGKRFVTSFNDGPQGRSVSPSSSSMISGGKGRIGNGSGEGGGGGGSQEEEGEGGIVKFGWGTRSKASYRASMEDRRSDLEHDVVVNGAFVGGGGGGEGSSSVVDG